MKHEQIITTTTMMMMMMTTTTTKQQHSQQYLMSTKIAHHIYRAPQKSIPLKNFAIFFKNHREI